MKCQNTNYCVINGAAAKADHVNVSFANALVLIPRAGKISLVRCAARSHHPPPDDFCVTVEAHACPFARKHSSSMARLGLWLVLLLHIALATVVEDTDPSIHYDGTWTVLDTQWDSGGTTHATNITGGTATSSFNGEFDAEDCFCTFYITANNTHLFFYFLRGYIRYCGCLIWRGSRQRRELFN